jgi:hypothetical protein
VEENFEEKLVRLAIVFSSALGSISICTAILTSIDIGTGTIFNLFTGQTIPDGKCYTLKVFKKNKK